MEREYILVSYRTKVFYIRTCDYFHSVKPTNLKVPFLCDVASMKNLYGKQPRPDQLNEVSHLMNVPMVANSELRTAAEFVTGLLYFLLSIFSFQIQDKIRLCTAVVRIRDVNQISVHLLVG